MTRGTLMWAAAALAGLALAVGITYAAGTLSSQRIGLSSEPLSAGDRLVAPSAVRRPPRTMPQPVPRPRRPVSPTTTAPPGGRGEAEDGGAGDD